MSAIRVLLVDDHYILREGVKVLIESESEIEVIASASTAEEGLARVLDSPVDLRGLFQKLNASTRTEAVAEALRRGSLTQKE